MSLSDETLLIAETVTRVERAAARRRAEHEVRRWAEQELRRVGDTTSHGKAQQAVLRRLITWIDQSAKEQPWSDHAALLDRLDALALKAAQEVTDALYMPIVYPTTISIIRRALDVVIAWIDQGAKEQP